jgi:uncharacterized protein (TIGR03083 family)
MDTVKAHNDQLIIATEAAADRICAVLKSGPNPDTLAVGTWSVRDVAAHVANGIPLYTKIVRGEGSTYTRLDRIAEFNDAGVATIQDRDCTALADRIESAMASFAAAVRTTPGDRKVAWHAGIMLPVSTVTAALLGEALIHGYDIAQASAQPWVIPPVHAGLVFSGLLPVLPYFVNRAAADGVQASFDIRLRGTDSPRVQLVFDDGTAHVASGANNSVDCHLSADPSAFLLVMYGRQGPLRPALTGKIVAWGRRPWLAFRMPSLLQRP